LVLLFLRRPHRARPGLSACGFTVSWSGQLRCRGRIDDAQCDGGVSESCGGEGFVDGDGGLRLDQVHGAACQRLWVRRRSIT
jgi:hypothetical protein